MDKIIEMLNMLKFLNKYKLEEKLNNNYNLILFTNKYTKNFNYINYFY